MASERASAGAISQPGGRSRRWRGWLSIAVAVAIAGASGLGLESWAQPSSPGGVGSPGSTSGGGVRGGCIQNPSDVSVRLSSDSRAFQGQLIGPATDLQAAFERADLVVATDANPVLAARIPSSAPGAKGVEVLVFDRQFNPIVQHARPLPGDGSATELEVPLLASGTALEPGETYYWTFSVLCDAIDGGDRSADPTVLGRLQLGGSAAR